MGFQSAPLTEARGDPPPRRQGSAPCQALFQSAPLTEARGDRRPADSICSCNVVSIRSPHRSKGRQRLLDKAARSSSVSIRSPHRSKGRHACSVNDATAPDVCTVSIRSPHRSKGRRLRLYGQARCPVSIRSPHRSKGRPGGMIHLARPAGMMFQSAPLTEARGDVASRLIDFAHASCSGFNPLPSPKQGETWIVKLPGDAVRRAFWFQSAPLTEARGDFASQCRSRCAA